MCDLNDLQNKGDILKGGRIWENKGEKGRLEGEF
jgi:hypothetical protein